jgi:hypothetical protein
MSFGQEIDWNKNFFTQFNELFKKVPLILADRKKVNINSDFGNYNVNCKNCFHAFAVAESENVFYANSAFKDENCFDVCFSDEERYCYENLHTVNNYQSAWLMDSKNCSDCFFLVNSTDCENCFMSNNLNHQQYVFRNQKLTKEEYFEKLGSEKIGNYQNLLKLKEEFKTLKENSLYRFANIVASQDVTGDNIFNSRGIRRGFWMKESENVSYSLRVLKESKDIHDVQGLVQGELVYESTGAGFNPYKTAFSFGVDSTKEAFYSTCCYGSSNIFGCVGLRNKEYCILNKQYSQQQYEALLPRLKELMNKLPYKDKKGRVYTFGEFFPSELSPFGYNETVAQDYFTLTEKEAKEKDFNWKNPEMKKYKIEISIENIPKEIKETSEDIVGKIIACEHSGKCNDRCTTAFKLVKEELQFYKLLGVPVPHLCPNCRYIERLKSQNPLNLWKRQCMCDYTNYTNSSKHAHHESGRCLNQFETPLAPDRKEVVYCEQCYQSEMA